MTEVARLSALLALTHPVPSVGTALAAVVAALPLLSSEAEWGRVLLLFAAVLFQQIAISVHNDWCDRDVDSAAKPGRAIPAQFVAARTALLVATGSVGLSILLSSWLGGDMVALVGLGLAAGYCYNAWLKRTPLSWVPFALAFPLIPLFGMAALDRWTVWWWTMFLIPLPAIVALHLIDALADYEHDAALGVNGLAQFLGRNAATKSAFALGGLSACAVGAVGTLLTQPGTQAAWTAQAGFVGATVLIALGGTHPSLQRPAVSAGAGLSALSWALATALA